MIILTGASASGKTEVGKLLASEYGYKKVITYTTRPMRIGEVDGVDYHFVSKDEFLRLKNENFFFETVEYNNNCYGTAKNSLNGKCYLIVDAKGLDTYNASELEFVSFYLDCDEDVRYTRMIGRGDNVDDAKKRIIVDRKAFPDSIKESVDFVIDGTKLTLTETVNKVMELVTKNSL